jgi:hypothetical protein
MRKMVTKRTSLNYLAIVDFHKVFSRRNSIGIGVFVQMHDKYNDGRYLGMEYLVGWSLDNRRPGGGLRASSTLFI